MKTPIGNLPVAIAPLLYTSTFERQGLFGLLAVAVRAG